MFDVMKQQYLHGCKVLRVCGNYFYSRGECSALVVTCLQLYFRRLSWSKNTCVFRAAEFSHTLCFERAFILCSMLLFEFVRQ